MPVAVAVVVTVLLQRHAGEASAAQITALLLLVLLAAFLERQYRHRR